MITNLPFKLPFQLWAKSLLLESIILTVVRPLLCSMASLVRRGVCYYCPRYGIDKQRATHRLYWSHPTAILQLRTYALYRQSPFVLLGMFLSCITSWAVTIWIIVMQLQTMTGNDPAYVRNKRVSISCNQYSGDICHSWGSRLHRTHGSSSVHLRYSIHSFWRGSVCSFIIPTIGRPQISARVPR